LLAASRGGAVVFKKMQEGKIFSEHVRGLKIKNESIEEIQKAQKKVLDVMVEGEAKRLEAEFYGESESDPERTQRIKMAVVTLAELIEKGTEIHPALNAPEKADNVFPDFKNLFALQSKVKQIAENTEK
jgi:hypothetical protein